MRPSVFGITAFLDAAEVLYCSYGNVKQMVRPGVWVWLNTFIDCDGVQIEGPVYIGSKVRIEAGAKVLGPTWIGHGSHLRVGSVSNAAFCSSTPGLNPGKLPAS